MTVTWILVCFFFFLFVFFFLVGDQNELVVMDFSANVSQTNFLFVEEIINDAFRA